MPTVTVNAAASDDVEFLEMTFNFERSIDEPKGKLTSDVTPLMFKNKEIQDKILTVNVPEKSYDKLKNRINEFLDISALGDHDCSFRATSDRKHHKIKLYCQNESGIVSFINYLGDNGQISDVMVAEVLDFFKLSSVANQKQLSVT